MNPLLQITKTGILEREVFSENAFPDYHILTAIETYNRGGSEKRSGEEFISALSPLWGLYKKESYVSLFKKFVDIEIGLEALSSDHSSHVNHVIQEFLFGYNILMNCEYLKTEYNFKESRNDPNSPFGELFFSWMAASLLHDVGYDIERVYEEEAIRENKNNFWDFMTERAITTNPLTFSLTGPGRKMIEDYILQDIEKIPGAPKFSYVEFENLFLRPVKNRKNWARYDHGIISAIKYLVELKRLQETHGGNYLDWPPNRHAALAMALHNFRYKDCDLRLSSKNNSTFIAYLLITCDEIQEWERERADVDSELCISGRNLNKKTELVGITFRNKYAYVIINHKLKDPTLKEEFKEYLNEKFILQKKHFPIKIQYPEMFNRFKNQFMKNVEKNFKSILSFNLAYGHSPNEIEEAKLEYQKKSLEIKREARDFLESEKQRLEIAHTEQTKNLLIPSEPTPIYEIFVDHRIEGESYLTIVFPI